MKMKKLSFIFLFFIISSIVFSEPLATGQIDLVGIKPYSVSQGKYDVTIINTYTPPAGSTTDNHANQFLSNGSIIPIDLAALPTGGNNAEEGHVNLFSVTVRGNDVPVGESSRLEITLRPFENTDNPNDLVKTHFMGKYEFSSSTGNFASGELNRITASDSSGQVWKNRALETNKDSNQVGPIDYEYNANIQINRLESNVLTNGAIYAMKIDVALVVEADS